MQRKIRGTVSKLVPLMLATAMTFSTTAAIAAPWEDVGNIGGVHVWRRDEGTGTLAFRGEVIAPVNIGKLVAVFSDMNQRQYWVDRYAASSVIEKTGPLSEIYWIKFKLPAIISDRDYVLRADGVIDAPSKTFTVNIKSVVDPRKGEDSCCTRATVNRTFYKFTALKAVNGVPQTKLEVEVNTDPKGLLPNWLVNMIQKEWPSKTLNGLVRRVQASQSQPMAELATWHD